MTTPIRLLVVDHETALLDAIARRLEMRDFAVTKAASGQAAAAGESPLGILRRLRGLDDERK